MFRNATTVLMVLLSLLYANEVWACSSLIARQSENSNNTFPLYTIGSNEPSDPETVGYFVNHLCIIAKNVTASIQFYTQAFGLRHIFTMQVSQHFSISYLGHSHGGRNGTGYQTVEEMNRQKNNIEGLIEILGIDVPEYDFSALQAPSKFSHIGMVVPDIQKTQHRLESMGANILKNTGDPQTLEGLTFFANLAMQLDSQEMAQVAQMLNISNTPLIVVADPDGNVIEVQSQEGSALLS